MSETWSIMTSIDRCMKEIKDGDNKKKTLEKNEQDEKIEIRKNERKNLKKILTF